MICYVFAAAVFAVGGQYADAGPVLYAAIGSNGENGQLFTVDPTTAGTTLVGNITAGGLPIGITGLAFNPTTGVLYGVTTAAGPNPNGSLVTIDPGTGNATVIGGLGLSGSGILGDITFVGGTLYGNRGGSGTKTDRLYTVDLTTGQATVVGPVGSNPAKVAGFGLAANAAGTIYGSLYEGIGFNTTATLDTFDPVTGARIPGVTLVATTVSGKIFDAFNSLAFGDAGVLYGVQSDRNSSDTLVNYLTTIDVTTGVVTQVGLLPRNIDAIAFSVNPPAAVPEPATLQMLALALPVAVAVAVRRRRRSPAMA